MKIYYFNDTDYIQVVFKNDLGDIPFILQPGSGSYFEISLEEKQVPFIKVWRKTVLIAGISDS